MAQTVLLKRSAVQNNIPTTANLALGEIALNTFDGKLFIRKDNGIASIIELTTSSNISYIPTGNITSTNVQDAINELDSEKQSILVSGTNIKTINSTSLLGSGDIVIAGTVDITDDTTTNSLFYPILSTTSTGTLTAKASSSKLSFNPSTGKLQSINVSGNVLTTNYSSTYSNNITTTTTSSTTLLSQPITSFYSYDIIIQAVNGTSFHTTKLLIIQNGTNVYLTEYNTIMSNNALGTYDANIVSGNLVISVIPEQATSTSFSFSCTMLSQSPLVNLTGDTGPQTLGGGSGVSSFTLLTDAPSSYVGNAKKLVCVKADETGLEFCDVSSGGTIVDTYSSVNPTLSGVTVANETQSVALTITNYNSNSVYVISVSAGSVVRSGATITWIMPQLSTSTVVRLTLTVTDPGKNAVTIFYDINAINLLTSSDSILLYENTTMSEFTTLNNTTIVSNKIVAGAGVSLTVLNNKVLAPYPVEVGDLITIDSSKYTVDSINLIADGAQNTSTTDSTNVMTGYSDSIGTVIYSGEYNGTYVAWRVFDAVDTTCWIGAGGSINGQYVGFHYNQKRIINKYTINGYGSDIDVNAAVKDWIFQGSNDGTTWTNLHTVTNATTWTSGEKRTYTFSNANSYYYYRVYITANLGSSIYVGMANLELIEAIPVVSGTTPVAPQFFTTASLLTKSAMSNIITQDLIDTDFTGMSNISVKYEFDNLVKSAGIDYFIGNTTINTGDIINLYNGTDLYPFIVADTIIIDENDIDTFNDGSLIRKYQFENNVNNTLGSNHATGYSCTYTTGKFGTCLSGGYATIPSSNINTFSVSFFLKASDISFAGGHYLFGNMGSGQLGTGNGSIFYDLGGAKYFTNPPSLVNNVWYHICLTVDAGIPTLYVDGISCGVGSAGGYAFSGVQYLATPSNSPVTSGTYNANALIDQLEIYNRVLTISEVNTLKNIGMKIINTSSTTAGTTPIAAYNINDYVKFNNSQVSNRIDTITSTAPHTTVLVTSTYGDVQFESSTRTIQTKVKLNNVGDKVSKITGTIQKLV